MEEQKMAEKIIKNKCMRKYSIEQKREIEKAFLKLEELILVQEQNGILFEKIFNNETIKYDQHNKGFYTFKAHGRDRTQIRILYRFIRTGKKEFKLEMHMVSIKRRNDNGYMHEFQNYANSYAY